MKNAFAFVIVALISLSVPARAEYVQMLLEQSFTMDARTSFSVNGSTASLSGRGTASLDDGAQQVSPTGGVALNIIFTDLNDPVFLQCQAGLAAELPRHASIVVSGAGDFTRAMLNGALNEISIRFTTLNSCAVAQM